MKTALLISAWIWIAAPLGWGVYQSVQKAMPLFEGQSSPPAHGGNALRMTPRTAQSLSI